MKALRCDRCGKYFDEPDNNKKPRLLILNRRMHFEGEIIGNVLTDPWEIDLCDDCYESLCAWLERKGD